MQGVRRGRRWNSLIRLLRFKGIGCCGCSWSFGVPRQLSADEELVGGGDESSGNSVCVNHAPAAAVMNLAAALAAERNSSRGEKMEKSLMRMLEEVEAEEDGDEIGGDEGGGGMLCCCVCMERGKGAAFIPCGHTYCRICSRELWLNRGSCPLCNCTIAEVLKIF